MVSKAKYNKRLNKFKTENDFSKRIYVGITGNKKDDWKNKLNEINKLKISKVVLFLQRFEKQDRKEIYQSLKLSKIKSIPLVHIRHDMDKNELDFLVNNYKTRYFTIHENSFKILIKWWGFYKKLYLEMNTDNIVEDFVKVNKIGGFCVDLSHFKVEIEKWSKEFEYIIKRRNVSRYFGCNHLNGYSYEKNTDLHTITSLKDFDYLKSLPEFIFGEVIGIETENNISEQLEYKNHLVKILNDRFY